MSSLTLECVSAVKILLKANVLLLFRYLCIGVTGKLHRDNGKLVTSYSAEHNKSAML